MPTWAAALSTPAATPCSDSPSAEVPEAVDATAATPSPPPISRKAGASATGDSAISTVAPTATASRPAAIAGRGRGIRGPSREPAITATLNGVHHRPVVSSSRPSAPC